MELKFSRAANPKLSRRPEICWPRDYQQPRRAVEIWGIPRINAPTTHRKLFEDRLSKAQRWRLGMAGHHRGKTVTKPFGLKLLELLLSEKQIPQVVEEFESGGKPKEALEMVELRPRQVRYQAALRPDT